MLKITIVIEDEEYCPKSAKEKLMDFLADDDAVEKIIERDKQRKEP